VLDGDSQSLALTSGGKRSIFWRLDSTTLETILSVFPISVERRAAMNSTGKFALR
jgi:hypothetical protein